MPASPRFTPIQAQEGQGPEDKDGASSIESFLLQEADVDNSSSEPTPISFAHNLPHLTPCSWEQFISKDFRPDNHVDLVSGIVVYRENMADVDHQDIISRFCTIVNILGLAFFANFNPSMRITEIDESLGSSSQSSDSSPPRRIPGKREPDLAFDERGNEPSSSRSRSPERKKIKYSETRLALAVLEVTSASTRNEDLYEKWTAYARTGIPLYIIFDRPVARSANGAVDNSPTIIVGSLQSHEGWIRSPNGDPDKNPKNTRGRSNSNTTAYTQYYRKIYRNDDIVDCEYFVELGLTVRQLLNRRYLLNHIEEIHTRRAMVERGKRRAEGSARHHKAEASGQRERADEEKRRADSAARRAERAEQRLRQLQ